MTLAELRERAERAPASTCLRDVHCCRLIAALCRVVEAADDMAAIRGEDIRDAYDAARYALDALLQEVDGGNR